MTRRTTITIVDENLWKWARKRTIDLDLKNISQYLFELIKKDRDGEIQMETRVEYSRGDFVRDLVECLVRATYGETDILYGKIKEKDGFSAIYNIIKTIYTSLKKRRFLIMTDMEVINDYLKTFETVPKFNVNKALYLIFNKLIEKENGIFKLVKTDKTPVAEEIQMLLDNVIKELKAE